MMLILFVSLHRDIRHVNYVTWHSPGLQQTLRRVEAERSIFLAGLYPVTV
jgi:hypothetical protein